MVKTYTLYLDDSPTVLAQAKSYDDLFAGAADQFIIETGADLPLIADPRWSAELRRCQFCNKILTPEIDIHDLDEAECINGC